MASQDKFTLLLANKLKFEKLAELFNVKAVVVTSTLYSLLVPFSIPIAYRLTFVVVDSLKYSVISK